MSDLDHSLRTEFDALTRRAGLTIPPERDGAMFVSFVAQRELLALLHRPFAYADEPAFIGGIAR